MNKTSNLSISKLCSIANVSRSSYYKYQNKKPLKKDIEIITLIKQIYWTNEGKLGYRRITMELHRKFNMIINHKKVLRLMRENGLKSKIRKKRKHSCVQRKNEKWTIAENLLQSNFKTNELNKIFSTDVSYLTLKNGKRFYLSAMKDLASGEIVAYNVSDKHNIQLILNTIDQLKIDNCNNCIIHSDRGSLYSGFQYIQKLKELRIKRSMSEPMNPTQNAPIESFFGHLKDEVDYKKCKDLEELKDKIDKYVYYYNTGRYQWNKNMLTPREIKEHLLSYK